MLDSLESREQTAQADGRDVTLAALRGNTASKRAFDIVAASAALVLASPVLCALTVAVAADGGPVLFRHRRIGRDGVPFMCLKFRTMVTDAPAALKQLLENDPQARAEWERDFKLRRDPRITPVGRVLRKTSLDELPQLFNVLRGEMSLVGPRPIVAEEVARYGAAIAHYFRCRPGITGLWQVSGRNDTGYAGRVRMDVEYSQTVSLVRDLGILVRTVKVIVLGKGAY